LTVHIYVVAFKKEFCRIGGAFKDLAVTFNMDVGSCKFYVYLYNVIFFY